jgi:DNA end-binding protein Ku
VARVVWKGAISFGLVHIPVSLYPGSTSSTLDFDLLDKRDFAPVGYQRVNKRTGKEVAPDQLVKGYEYAKGEYVVVSDADFRQANVKATQTVEIQAFVEAAEIAPCYFDTPYYLEPGKRAGKGYALLRETLRRTGRVGVATVVLRARQHLALVMPVGRLLVLNTLRFADEIRPAAGLDLPSANLKTVGVSPKELQMAERLVEDMTEAWRPDAYRDTYRADLLARIERKVKRGETHDVGGDAEREATPRRGAQVIDLMAALKKSLEKKGERGRSRTRRSSGRSVRKRAQPDEQRRRA